MKSKQKNLLVNGIKSIIGILILVILFFKFFSSLSKLKTIHIKIYMFLSSIIFYTNLNFLLSFRLWYLYKKHDKTIKFKDALLSHYAGMLAGDLTPGRSGYLITPQVLKILGYDQKTGYSVILIPQGIEFLLKGLGCIFAIVFLFSTHFFNIYLILAAIFISISGIILLSLLIIDTSLFTKIPFISKFSYILQDFRAKNIETVKYVKEIILMYIIGWVLVGFQWYFIAKSIGLKLSYFECFLLHPLLTSLTFVPLTPAGLGVMESGTIFVLYLLGISPEYALIFALLARTSNLLGDSFGIYPLVKFIKKY